MKRQRIIALALAGLVALCSPVVGQVSVEERFSAEMPPLVSAHRSATMGGAPENTIAWIAYGIERGVDALHINPQVTADGRYVLMHDPTLNRTTNVEAIFPDGPPDGPTREARGGRDYVADYTAAQIAALHVIAGEQVTDSTVPSLEAALDVIGDKVIGVLGLKSYEVETLAAALEGYPTGNLLLFDLYYSGTDQSKLRALSDATGIDVAVSLYQTRDALKDLDGIYRQIGPALRMVSVRGNRVTPDFRTRATELGVAVMVSGWAGPEDAALQMSGDTGPWKAVFDAGLSASTDRPDDVLRILGR